MIYFDSCYLAKCYVAEADSVQVRAAALASGCVASSQLARAELASLFHRQVREGNLTTTDAAQLMAQFDLDLLNGVVAMLPLSDKLVQDAAVKVAALPASVLIRAGDVLHLTCAAEHGFKDIYTSDKHMLTAAPYFGLNGIKL